MNSGKIIQDALQRGESSLSEAASKEVLAEYGIPVVQELKCFSAKEAAQAAEKLGFPVVIKAFGAKLTHKTEMGVVRLNLNSAREVEEAATEVGAAAGDLLEGFLVQPQVMGDREFVAGLFTDPQFGPVVMFGIGGVFTEAFEDVAFRLAPCSEADVDDMLEELRSRSLLDDFRGRKAVDRRLIKSTLSGLSNLAKDNPEVLEVDLNPLKAMPDGRLVAVDALVVLGGRREKESFPPPIEPGDIGAFFQPKSIAFIGASAQMGKWGHMLSTNVIAGGYKGDVYFVNSKGGEIFGKPAYKSILDVPGEVDLAVVTIPAAHVMGLFPQLRKKGIRRALLITSGFGETGQEGKALEKDLVEKASENDVIILGPNTMGICNPHINLYCIGSHIRTPAGPTALVSRSGNMGGQLMGFAEEQGIGIRAFCGSGNEAMITIEDGLEGFEVDPATKTVVLYLESVKNGRRFYESAKRLGKTKPVVVLKGGRTRAGGRAAASHTGALASNTKVFDAACRQAGIVSVVRPTELLDLSAAFSSLPLPPGPRVGIVTLGGGWGVVTADLCDKCGLEVPELTPDLIAEIDKHLPPYWSKSNPIDLVGERSPELFQGVTRALMEWDGCDAVIVLGIIGRRHSFARMINSALASDPGASSEHLMPLHAAMTDYEAQFVKFLVGLMEKNQKPLVGVPLMMSPDDKTVVGVEGSPYSGVFFDTPERAVNALARMHEYQRFFKRENGN